MLHVLAPGLRTTIQDLGRWGHVREGVPAAGAADPWAHALAQELVGNAAEAAGLEVVGAPFRFRCDDRRVIAVTGRDARLRGRGVLPSCTAVLARPGQELVLEGGAQGRFAYLAISGGIAPPAVLGSRSTYLAAGIGPFPRALAAGDALPLGAATVDAGRAGTGAAPLPYGDDLRAMRGPHAGRFPADALTAFFAADFTVGADSDRMGLRLEGAQVAAEDGEILTCGLVAGAIQVPRGGAPIVMLADHQTTGGYPVIATVIAADLGRAAQLVPGERVRFAEVDRDEAVAARREMLRLVTALA